jgi:hypothetical protein
MKIAYFLPVGEDYNCEADTAFLSPQDFKAHLLNKDDWIHHLIFQFVKQLYEVTPAKYPVGNITPVPIAKETSSRNLKSVECNKHECRG